MGGILHYFLSGTVLSLARMLVGLFRIKYVAIAFGAAGVGVLSQGTQVQQLAVSIASLSLAAGMIQRMLSGARDQDPEREKRVLATAFCAQMVMMIFGTLIILPFLPQLSELIFDRADMKIHFIFILLSVPFYVMSSGYIEALFFSLNRFDLYVKSSVVAAVLGLFVFIALVYFAGIYGMFLSFLASGALFLALNIGFIYKERKPAEIFILKGFSWQEFAVLFRYSSVLLAGGMASYFTNLALRTYVVNKLGIEMNGLIQVPVALSAYYSSLLTNLMWSKLHTRASEVGNSEIMHRDFFQILDFLVLAQVGMAIILMAGLELFITLIYTKEFMPAKELVAVFLLGDLFYFTVMAFTIYLLGIGMIRRYLFIILTQCSAFLLLGYFLEPILKLRFFTAAYALSALITSLPVLYWMIRMNGVSLDKKIKYFLKQLICALFLLAQAYLLYNDASWWSRCALASVFVFYAIFFMFHSGYLTRENGRIQLKL